MDIGNNVACHAAKSACKDMHATCSRAARQAAARPGSGPKSVPCVLPTRARGVECCMCTTTSDIIYHARMPCRRYSTCWGSVPRFPGMTEIGHSQKARHRTPAHAMMHVNERACLDKHARHMTHAILHAHAHAACDPIPASGVSTDTFSSANDEGIARSVGSTAPASTNIQLQAVGPGCVDGKVAIRGRI